MQSQVHRDVGLSRLEVNNRFCKELTGPYNPPDGTVFNDPGSPSFFIGSRPWIDIRFISGFISEFSFS
tara:strand:+ start:1137 stop:1340 length:204 start_codon:yes stop_codon:yes gene_type:complete